jgi:hypothetical protein
MTIRMRNSIAAVALLACFVLPAHADLDYTDIWYEGAAKSGWGVNLAQNDNAIFATFFVYDVNRNPTWYGRYTGTLYTTRGAYYGSEPFDPALNNFTVAGTMTFTATEPTRGTFTYTVNGVSVAKFIERQLLVPLSLAGNYIGAERYTYAGSGCADTQSTFFYFDQYRVAQTPVAGTAQSTLTLLIDDGKTLTNVCKFEGSVIQRGKVLELAAGTSTCPNGTAVPIRIYDLRPSSNGGFELQWTAQTSPNCTQSGRMNALRQ